MADKNYAKLMKPFVLHSVTTTGEEIGRGAYVRVFQVKYCTKYAAREIHSQLLDFSSADSARELLHQFFSMCYLLSRCRHPNIVQFIGIYNRESNKGIPTMVMEQMECSLTTFIAEQSEAIPLRHVLSILHDVSLGL